MKIIFLDIDGVLNCKYSKSRCGGYIGIDDKKVDRLKEICDNTNAKIVLVSSWKIDWSKNTSECGQLGAYMVKKLAKAHIYIMDKTDDNGYNRGEGIINWLKQRDNTESWIVLDDEVFEDYSLFSIFPHLVKSEFHSEYGGLQNEHVKRAIELLNSKGE